MKTRAAIVAIAILAAACASSRDINSGPPVEVQIAPIGLSSDTLYFPGPLAVQFAVTVTNPTNELLTFRSLQLRTIGPGAFYIRSGTVNVNRTIPPRGSTTVSVSTWGRANGGYLRAEEPVNLQGVAYFSTPSNHNFVKMANEILNP